MRIVVAVGDSLGYVAVDKGSPCLIGPDRVRLLTAGVRIVTDDITCLLSDAEMRRCKYM